MKHIAFFLKFLRQINRGYDMKTEVLSFEELEYKMEVLKTCMITTGKLKGLSHPDTIKLSQELDVIMHKRYGTELKIIER